MSLQSLNPDFKRETTRQPASKRAGFGTALKKLKSNTAGMFRPSDPYPSYRRLEEILLDSD
jgi:hypothetical protein